MADTIDQYGDRREFVNEIQRKDVKKYRIVDGYKNTYTGAGL
ncbi:MAG: hypothetical protein PHH85_05350 [Candidatus Methanoperedens sp.]|nr:hypothetical protein [Candidatus Methanoperedens sp.]